jgi:hypothetical protein
MTEASAFTRVDRSAEGRPLGRASKFKGAGYLISSMSVVLLAVPSLKAALEQPPLFAFLIAGALASIGGMLLRWHSHRLERQEQAEQRG